ncbi:MAG: hypothetical protein EXQ96_08335 [Alphaproteobacteria bacterium]|nr:hypothetical protein [Alphaproteobacteria bacterium]
MTAAPGKPVDFELLHAVTDGDEALAHEILDLFLATARKAVADLARHPAGSTGWTMAAHTLKGSAGNVGAATLADLAGQAESTIDAAEGAQSLEHFPD